MSEMKTEELENYKKYKHIETDFKPGELVEDWTGRKWVIEFCGINQVIAKDYLHNDIKMTFIKSEVNHVWHDGCTDCEHLMVCEDEYCCRCKGTVLICDPEYKTRPDLWEPEEKRVEAECVYYIFEMSDEKDMRIGGFYETEELAEENCIIFASKNPGNIYYFKKAYRAKL